MLRINTRKVLLAMTLGSLVSTQAVWAGDGESVYRSGCIECHADGVAGAPKFADRSAWLPRLAKGEANLVRSVINGMQGYAGKMPPRGGNPGLNDIDIRSAVRFMMDAVPN